MAHNAGFDQLIWEYIGVNDYNFPTIPFNKWYCTSAQCRVNAIPAGLDNASWFLTGKRMKMGEGKKLIKLLSLPNQFGEFVEDWAALQRMGEYCLQDVVATVEVFRRTRPMTQQEHREWLVSEKINDRGVKVDVKLARACTKFMETERKELARQVEIITNGYVPDITNVFRAKDWVIDRLSFFNQHDIIDQYFTTTTNAKLDDNGDPIPRLVFDRSARQRFLADVDTGDISADDKLIEFVRLVEEGNKSSVAKFERMANLADDNDNRVRGAYMYAGASQTKRFSAKGVQVHNFPRDSFSPAMTDTVRATMLAGAVPDFEGGVSNALSKLLRPSIIPERGKTFIVCDWSAIEARVLPWLADSYDADKVLEVFDRDEDLYVATATSMGLSDRQIGKIAALALGYAGGVNALNAMARGYGMEFTEEQAKDIVTRWRAANNWAVKFWRQCELAARNAVNHPQQWFKAGRLSYFFAPNLIRGTLLCKLPDGSVIQYPHAKVEGVETPWGEINKLVTYAKAGLTAKQDALEWPRSTLYGGLAVENATQATAACVLRDSLTKAEDEGLNVVLHVHDEIILEESVELVDSKQSALQKIMETPPDWAAYLPLKAEPEVKARYGK